MFKGGEAYIQYRRIPFYTSLVNWKHHAWRPCILTSTGSSYMMFTRDAYKLTCFQTLYSIRRRQSLVQSVWLTSRIDTAHVSIYESAPTKGLDHVIFAVRTCSCNGTKATTNHCALIILSKINCDRLSINHPFTANINNTVRATISPT